MGRDFLRLRSTIVVLLDLATEEHARMCRIGNDVAIFFGTDRMPIAFGDFSPIAAANHARGPRLLLTAADPIREAVVGVDVIHLRGRLVVPRTPCRAVIDRDRRTLIAG